MVSLSMQAEALNHKKDYPMIVFFMVYLLFTRSRCYWCQSTQNMETIEKFVINPATHVCLENA